MKAIPNKNGSISIHPETAAESFLLSKYEDGVSRLRVWEGKGTLHSAWYPRIIIFPEGTELIKLEDLENSDE